MSVGKGTRYGEFGDRHSVVIGTGAQSVLGFMRPRTAASAAPFLQQGAVVLTSDRSV
jgi:hypothetical protein